MGSNRVAILVLLLSATAASRLHAEESPQLRTEPTEPTSQASREPSPETGVLAADDSKAAPATYHVSPYLSRARFDGEIQLRFRSQTSFELPTGGRIEGTTLRPTPSDSTGQGTFGGGWARLGLRYDFGKHLSLVAQEEAAIDVLFGDVARGVSAERTPRNVAGGIQLRPRALYLELVRPELSLRVGHVPVHWGEGMVWNDGTVRSLFGDYRRADISERLLLESAPIGSSHVVVGYAQEVVYEDAETRLAYGDRAVGTNAFVRADIPDLGRFGALVNYKTGTSGHSSRLPYGEKLDRVMLDVTGSVERAADPISGYAHAAFEAAAAWGTVASRTADGARGQTQTLRGYGFLARADISAFTFAQGDASLPPSYPCDVACRAALAHRGRLELAVEIGYASGDSSPENGTYSRFVFDHNHRVGLLLFDEALRSMSARAASNATGTADALSGTLGLPRVARSPDLYPTQGGVAGAMYLYPTLVYRPTRSFDVRMGVVKAQSTAALATPSAPAARDLGTELDLGLEGRIPLAFRTYISLGAEGAVLFPGAGLENSNASSGSAIGTLWLGQLRAGYVF